MSYIRCSSRWTRCSLQGRKEGIIVDNVVMFISIDILGGNQSCAPFAQYMHYPVRRVVVVLLKPMLLWTPKGAFIADCKAMHRMDYR